MPSHKTIESGRRNILNFWIVFEDVIGAGVAAPLQANGSRKEAGNTDRSKARSMVGVLRIKRKVTGFQCPERWLECQHLRGGPPLETKTEVAVADAGVVVAAVGNPNEPRIVVPTSTTEHAGRMPIIALRIRLCGSGVFFEPVPYPLPDIPSHITQALLSITLPLRTH